MLHQTGYNPTKSMELVQDMLKASPVLKGQRKEETDAMVWQCSPTSWLKINTDGALNVSDDRGGTGVVHFASLTPEFRILLCGSSSHDGILFARRSSRGYHRVIIETDCIIAYRW